MTCRVVARRAARAGRFGDGVGWWVGRGVGLCCFQTLWFEMGRLSITMSLCCRSKDCYAANRGRTMSTEPNPAVVHRAVTSAITNWLVRSTLRFPTIERCIATPAERTCAAAPTVAPESLAPCKRRRTPNSCDKKLVAVNSLIDGKRTRTTKRSC